MIIISRSISERLCSTAILIVVVAAMLAVCIAPAMALTGAGNTLDFDGIDDYVDLGNLSGGLNPYEVTVEPGRISQAGH